MNKFNFERIKRNIFGNSFRFSSSIIIQVFYLPLMFYAWGSVNTGYWLFLIAAPQILSFWKINFSEAAKQELTLRNGKNESYLYTISLCLTFLVILFFGLIYFVINILFLEYFEIFKTTKVNYFYYIIIVIFFSFSLDLVSNNILTLSQYKGKIYKSEILISIFDSLEKITVGIIGLLTSELIIAAYSYLIIKILKLLTSKYLFKFNFKFYLINKNKKLLKNIFKKSLNVYYLNITNAINISGLIYIIGFFFTAEIVAMVSAIQTMFRFTIYSINRVFIDVLYFEFANYIKLRNVQKTLEIYKFQRFYFILFLILFGLFTIFCGEFIFNIWTNYNFTLFNNLILLITLDSIISIISYNNLLLARSLNKIDKISFKILFITIIMFSMILYFDYFKIDIEKIYILVILKNFVECLYTYFFNKNFMKKLKLNEE